MCSVQKLKQDVLLDQRWTKCFEVSQRETNLILGVKRFTFQTKTQKIPKDTLYYID